MSLSKANITFPKFMQGDKILWGVTFLFFIISFAVVASVGSAISVSEGQGVGSQLFKHLSFQILGVVVFLFAYAFPLHWLKRIAPIVLVIGLFLVVLTVLIGKTTNDATRWLVLPGGVQIQTSELAKAAFVIFFAYLAERHYHDDAKFLERVRIFNIVLVPAVGLIFIHNLSSGVLIYLIMLTMMKLTGIKFSRIFRFIAIAVTLALVYSLIAEAMDWPGRMETWINRIHIFLDPDSFPKETKQPDTAQIGILEGAFDFVGPGKSFTRYLLYQAQSDYIFALIISEWTIGLGIIVMGLYFVILVRGIMIVQSSKTVFPAILALGFTLMLTFQAFVHIAVAVGLFPVTGQPLPLISMGGTSMLVSSLAMGVLLNASVLAEQAKRAQAKNINSDKQQTQDTEPTFEV